MSGKVELLVFTTLFPSEAQPTHGIFVENRLTHLLSAGHIGARVLAPVPWVPKFLARTRRLASYARTPKAEKRSDVVVRHPRYPVIPKIGMTLAPLLLFSGSLHAARKMREEGDFDVIDAHYFYPDGIAAIMLGAVFRKPVVITARGTDVNLIPQYKLPRAMIRWGARRAAGIVAVSQAIKDAVVALGVPDSRVTVLRNGVNLKTFHPGGRDGAREKLHLRGPTLLSVGHLIERKGHAFAIAALPRLKGCTLLIAGDGPERQALHGLAESLKVADRVRFLGSVPHVELQQVYAAADALILASSREGWPNVLLESMACGTPVVATSIWGNPEVVSQPAAGVLMKSRSAEGVADAINALFSALPDRDATRAYAEGFSWDATSEGQRRLFDAILAKR